MQRRFGPPPAPSPIPNPPAKPDLLTARRRPVAPEVEGKLYTPDDSARDALRDLMTLPQELWPNIRYLSLYNIHKIERADYIRIVNLVLNSLSRARGIVPPQVVVNSDETLIRIDFNNYRYISDDGQTLIGWDYAVWEKLAELNFYFSVNITRDEITIIEKTVPVRKLVTVRYPNGFRTQEYRIVNEVQQEKSVKSVTDIGPAPWLDTDTMVKLVNYTQSRTPIFRADEFVVVGFKPPFYYDFLGLGNKLQDFFDMLFVNEEDLKKAQIEIRGVVVRSGQGEEVIPVARNNRILIRLQSIFGYIWMTRDAFKSTDENEYLRNLLDEKYNATEVIGVLPNTLQCYYLANSDGVRQDAAPIDIAIDNIHADRQVTNGRSCMSCHKTGINPFKPLPQELVNNQIHLATPDPIKQKVLQRTYISNIRQFVANDQQVYNNAVKTATFYKGRGLSSREAADLFTRIYNKYAENSITPYDVQFEVGLPLKELQPLLATATDPYNLGLSERQYLPARRDLFEQYFKELMQRVYQLQQKGADEP